MKQQKGRGTEQTTANVQMAQTVEVMKASQPILHWNTANYTFNMYTAKYFS